MSRGRFVNRPYNVVQNHTDIAKSVGEGLAPPATEQFLKGNSEYI